MYSAGLFSFFVKLYAYFRPASMLIAIFKMITKYITKQKLFWTFAKNAKPLARLSVWHHVDMLDLAQASSGRYTGTRFEI